MDEKFDHSLFRNGVGSPLEQIEGTVNQHRLWSQGWLAIVVQLGIRNEDMLSADRVDFAHTASVELESNTNATGCAGCMRGDCSRPAHFANDPTYVTIEWSTITYSNFDHMNGVRK